MPRDNTRIALNVLMGLIVAISMSALAYRIYYHGGANKIAKFLLRRASHDYRQVRRLPETLRRALSWIGFWTHMRVNRPTPAAGPS
jgi:hypothetical protein